MNELRLEYIKDLSIDNIINLYRKGYSLAEPYTLQYPVDYTCPQTNIQIAIGATLTGLWNYVFKVKDIDATNRTALIGLLLSGTEVDSRVMGIGDIFPVTNPSISSQFQGIVITNIYISVEQKVVFANFCQWTQQDTVFTDISIPTTVEDGKSYTVIARITKSISGNPIAGEKVYITENGTRIVETTTSSDGTLSLPFIYHAGFSYSVLYPGTTFVNGIERVLVVHTVPTATHLFNYTYPVALPDFLITIFRAVPDFITRVMALMPVDVGWDILEMNISGNQISIYAKKLGSLDEIGFAVTCISMVIFVFGVAMYLIGGVAFGPAYWGAIGIIVGILLMYSVKIIDLITNTLFGSLTNKPTNADVKANADKFKDDKIKQCDDAYAASTKDVAACNTYVQCLRDAYSNYQEYTLAYLFKKAASELTLNAKKLRSDIDEKCIKAFAAGTITCDQLITCAKNEGGSSLSTASTIVEKYYPAGDTYTAPWEQPGLGGLLGGLGGLLVIGALVVGGYLVSRSITGRKEKTVVEVRPEIREK